MFNFWIFHNLKGASIMVILYLLQNHWEPVQPTSLERRSEHLLEPVLCLDTVKINLCPVYCFCPGSISTLIRMYFAPVLEIEHHLNVQLWKIVLPFSYQISNFYSPFWICHYLLLTGQHESHTIPLTDSNYPFFGRSWPIEMGFPSPIAFLMVCRMTWYSRTKCILVCF